MVSLGRPAFDELIPHAQRKRNIDETVAVHVPDLAAANTEFGTTKTMRSNRDFFPTLDHITDSLSPSRHRHGSVLHATPSACETASLGWMPRDLAKLPLRNAEENHVGGNRFLGISVPAFPTRKRLRGQAAESVV